MKTLSNAALILVVLTLTACGGGGGGSDAPVPIAEPRDTSTGQIITSTKIVFTNYMNVGGVGSKQVALDSILGWSSLGDLKARFNMNVKEWGQSGTLYIPENTCNASWKFAPQTLDESVTMIEAGEHNRFYECGETYHCTAKLDEVFNGQWLGWIICDND